MMSSEPMVLAVGWAGCDRGEDRGPGRQLEPHAAATPARLAAGIQRRGGHPPARTCALIRIHLFHAHTSRECIGCRQIRESACVAVAESQALVAYEERSALLAPWTEALAKAGLGLQVVSCALIGELTSSVRAS